MTTPRPDRKRKGSPEWIRLGELLADRRAGLSPDYEGHGGRAAFARDRGVNLKLIQDIELNARENFTAPTLRDVIAPAYRVTFESVRAALAGGDLEPAPEPEPGPEDAPYLIDPDRPVGRPGGMITPELVDRADVDYMDAAREREAELRRQGITEPDGEQMFPGSVALAAAYDADRLRGSTVRQAAWVACLMQARADQREASGHRPRRGSAGA